MVRADLVAACIILAIFIGATVGVIHGQRTERVLVAHECRQAGAFTVKRTGFSCEVIR